MSRDSLSTPLSDPVHADFIFESLDDYLRHFFFSEMHTMPSVTTSTAGAARPGFQATAANKSMINYEINHRHRYHHYLFAKIHVQKLFSHGCLSCVFSIWFLCLSLCVCLKKKQKKHSRQDAPGSKERLRRTVAFYL